MKTRCEVEKKFLIDKLCRIPLIKNCKCISSAENEFRLLIRDSGDNETTIRVLVYETVTPMAIKKVAATVEENEKRVYLMLMAPYISEKSDQVCGEAGIGYADLSGNILLSIDGIYISEKGNPNKYPKRREVRNIFYLSSTKTLMILRKMLEDSGKTWRIKELAEEAECSIGMVSRVKDKLCEQLWAEMTPEGLKLINPRGLLDAWSNIYSRSAPKMIPCYTLETLPKFENRIREVRDQRGIDGCLTGLAGGTRYVPVVRYNRVHVLVRSENIAEFMEYTGCKKVESGANVMLIEAQPDQMEGLKEINGDLVASAVQIFLDCALIKGRGAEMADAIFEKEIRK